jgi:hypothetical protein
LLVRGKPDLALSLLLEDVIELMGSALPHFNCVVMLNLVSHGSLKHGKLELIMLCFGFDVRLKDA